MLSWAISKLRRKKKDVQQIEVDEAMEFNVRSYGNQIQYAYIPVSALFTHACNRTIDILSSTTALPGTYEIVELTKSYFSGSRYN